MVRIAQVGLGLREVRGRGGAAWRKECSPRPAAEARSVPKVTCFLLELPLGREGPQAVGRGW